MCDYHISYFLYYLPLFFEGDARCNPAFLMNMEELIAFY